MLYINQQKIYKILFKNKILIDFSKLQDTKCKLFRHLQIYIATVNSYF